jgi:2-polyprenyl-6-hydroxyphenyl methylase/3-demethylubiquinone-9 3-methyltransferase
MRSQRSYSGAVTTVDASEIARFSAMAKGWWDADGPMRELHRMNPVRLKWLKQQAGALFARDEKDPKALGGLTVLDIGCGAGIVSEPLARMGAAVTGIDPAPDVIAAAKAHAAESGLAIDYRAATVEEIVAGGARFDIVTALEVVEHVTDVSAFVAAAANAVKPGGLLVLSTINRTLKAFLLAIVGAEYVLQWVPRGTHEYAKLVTPSELSAALRKAGFKPTAETGLAYAPFDGEWRLSSDMDVNYLMAAKRA